VCPHCDVRLDNVRCASCYTLQAPGSFSCGRCGQALDLEPRLDATDAPCPRCSSPLESMMPAPSQRWDDAAPERDGRVHECPRCGGLFVPREALVDILSRAERSGSSFADPRRALVRLEEVKYLPCPLCRNSMNRVNFGKLSGVIVDVCRKHGTWFDAGELTRVVAFASSGGLEKTRTREREEKEASAANAATAHASVMIGSHREELADLLSAWRVYLESIFL
jgi:Zn-finger nucleic acid-binding protein